MLPQTAVRLVTIDDAGEETSQLESAVTDESGHFRFQLRPETNASVVVAAELPGETLHGFYAGRSREISVHPLTEDIYRLIVDITATPEGRSLADFSAAELREIVDAAFDAGGSSVDLTDDEALLAFLRREVGRKIALAAGGMISAQSTAALEGEDTTDTISFGQNIDICAIGRQFHLLESDAFRFDIEEDGSLCGGTSPTLSKIFQEKAFTLNFPEEIFFTYAGSTFPDAGKGTAPIENERQIFLGPYSLVQPSSRDPGPWEEDTLSVARKIYVPVSGDFVRYLEIFQNSGTEDRTLNVEVKSYLTTASLSQLLTVDSGAASPTTADRFIVAYDAFGDAPSVGFAVQDGFGSVAVSKLNYPGKVGAQVNEITYGWSPLVIPAGTTRTLLHYGKLTTSRLAADMHAQMTDLVESPDMTLMGVEELAGLLNFTSARGTILGEAGSVVGRASVAAENERTAQTAAVKARPDGSFAIPLDAESGDRIQLTASDGLVTALRIP